jgi:hypothetical protein
MTEFQALQHAIKSDKLRTQIEIIYATAVETTTRKD